MNPYSIVSDIVFDWTKTQHGTFTDQLNCGARAFDLRLTKANDDILIFHHGGIEVNLTVEV